MVQVLGPTLRDNVTVSGVSLPETLREMARHARRLGRYARTVEAQTRDAWPAER